MLLCGLLLFCGELCAAPPVKVAIIQSTFEWGDVDRNIELFGQKITSIEGCDLIVLPELFTSGCDMQKKSKEQGAASRQAVARRYQETLETMQQWAKSTRATVMGSVIYSEDGLFYNRLLAVRPSGEYQVYDKHNCFKHGSFTPGDKHLVVDIKGHRFATYICYDLRFSEWSANNGRYDTAIYIANWPTSRSEDWSTLLKERAVENRANVIGVNCVGRDARAQIDFMGNSSVLLAAGDVVAQCATNKEQVIIVDLK